MTRPGTRKSSDGMAMIMVLVMVIIFASLILAVVISSSTAIRRAHYYKDKAVALQIAESGLQEVLFKMNYENYYSGIYPFTYDSTPETQIYPFGFHATDFATVQIDPDGTGQDTRLLSTGRYKGRTAQIRVDLRSYAQPGDALNSETSGIPDAFTKKTIYAAQTLFDPPALPGGRIIKGNVTTISSKPSPFPWTEATWTEIKNLTPLTPEQFRLQELVMFETGVCQFAMPPFTTSDDTYSDSGFLYNAAYPGGVDVNTLTNGVYWNGTDTYYFGRRSDNTATETFLANNKRILVNANVLVPSNAGQVTVNNYFRSTENITINKNITTTTAGNFAFEVLASKTFSMANGLTITGNLVVKGNNPSNPLNLSHTILGNVAYDNNITVSGTTSVSGNMLSQGDITVNAGLTVAGSIVCSHETTARNHTVAINSPTTINAGTSLYDAAILVYPLNDGTTINTGLVNISATTAITLGEYQKTAILVSAVNGVININNVVNPLAITYAHDPPDQFAIVNYSGNNAKVNIYTNNLSLRGSIYSYKDILLDDLTQRITGILIAGNELRIGSNSTIVYDPASYSNPTVYKGFSAGRRRYVPLPGSWEVVW